MDMVSFTNTAEKLKPEETVNLLNEMFDLAAEQVKAYNGIIDKFIGDAMLAFFDSGNHQDDALNAVKTGIRIIEKLKERNVNAEIPIRVRVGINSGEAVMGNVGSKAFRKDYTIIGDPVNVAARLESKAPPMRVLVGPATYDLTKDKINYEKYGELELKGKTNKVPAYLVSY